MSFYTTVSAESGSEFTEKKSRFIGEIFPVENEEEALKMLAMVKSRYPTANHHVFAYVLRENNTERASDDGEPSGTGGVPILNVIKGNHLTNVLIVVTRYFGGVLLGTGGLSRAYSEGAKIAVDAAAKKIVAETSDYSFKCDYDLYGKVERYFMDQKIMILSSDFGEIVSVSFRIPEENNQKVLSDLTELSSGRISPKIVSKGWNELK